MPIIDFHNHYYPPEYIQALEKGPSAVRITHDAEGNPWLHYPGDYNVAVRGHRDIDYREQVLRQQGIDTQVITLTTPGTHVEKPATPRRLRPPGEDTFPPGGDGEEGEVCRAGHAAPQRSGGVWG